MLTSIENKIIDFINSSDPAMICMFCLVLFFVLIGFVAYGIKELFINYFDTKTHGFNRVDKSQHDSTLNFKNIFFLDNN